jgi:phosphatidylglycerophosphate synthase
MSSTYEPKDRRPIATRERATTKRVAAWLVRRRASANAISVAGMIVGLASGAALAATREGTHAWIFWLASAALIQLRLAANMLDGMVAVSSGTASPVGELYNEVPDRVSDSATLIGLGFAAGGEALLGFAAALAAMFTAYIRTVGKVAGAPQDFSGPMAKPHRMFLATVTSLYCAIAPAAWQPKYLGIGIAGWVLAMITAGSIVTALRRLAHSSAILRAPRTP